MNFRMFSQLWFGIAEKTDSCSNLSNIVRTEDIIYSAGFFGFTLWIAMFRFCATGRLLRFYLGKKLNYLVDFRLEFRQPDILQRS